MCELMDCNQTLPNDKWQSCPRKTVEFPPNVNGRVAELVDARDLKSREGNPSCGFESRLGYCRFALQ